MIEVKNIDMYSKEINNIFLINYENDQSKPTYLKRAKLYLKLQMMLLFLALQT